MGYIYIIIAVLVSGGYVAYSSYKISSLKSENQSLNEAVQVSLRANKAGNELLYFIHNQIA